MQKKKKRKYNKTKNSFQMLTKICMIYNAAYNTYRNLTSVVSTLTGSVYFSVAVPSNEKKQMWGQFSYLFKEKSHTHVNVLLVTRFRWLRPNLGLSHHSLFLLFLFFLACSILMSLCSVKVTTKQHFVQNVLQWLVWNKDSVTSQKTKRWLNNTQIHEFIVSVWWRITSHEKLTRRPCHSLVSALKQFP